MSGCDVAWEELVAMHEQYLDQTDLDPLGHSRAAALWLLAGRTLGLLRALLTQVHYGIGDEALVTDRAIHEAIQLQLSFCVPDSEAADGLVRVWLADEGAEGQISQRAGREVQDGYEQQLADAMAADGLEVLQPTWRPISRYSSRTSGSLLLWFLAKPPSRRGPLAKSVSAS